MPLVGVNKKLETRNELKITVRGKMVLFQPAAFFLFLSLFLLPMLLFHWTPRVRNEKLLPRRDVRFDSNFTGIGFFSCLRFAAFSCERNTLNTNTVHKTFARIAGQGDEFMAPKSGKGFFSARCALVDAVAGELIRESEKYCGTWDGRYAA